jgi:hypothetical protein
MVKLHARLQACSFVIAAVVLPALAQTSGKSSAATCSTAPTSLTAFTFERTLNLVSATGTALGAATSQVGVFTTFTPNINPTVLAAVVSGAQEVREQASLNTTTNVLTVQAFTVAPGSPSPTPPVAINTGQILWNYQVQVNSISFSCQPVPSILITGTIANNFPVTPFGNASGALAAVGIGYTTDNPPKLNNVVTLIPGLAGLYSASATGTLTFPSASVTPPGTAGNAPVIVFTPGPTQQSINRQFQLDASKSTDPNGLQLTFSWTQVNTNISAAIANANTATPLVMFGGGQGDYTFQVVVTNSKGASSTAQTTISYFGR